MMNTKRKSTRGEVSVVVDIVVFAVDPVCESNDTGDIAIGMGFVSSAFYGGGLLSDKSARVR